jgi:hypothetical protein
VVAGAGAAAVCALVILRRPPRWGDVIPDRRASRHLDQLDAAAELIPGVTALRARQEEAPISTTYQVLAKRPTSATTQAAAGHHPSA